MERISERCQTMSLVSYKKNQRLLQSEISSFDGTNFQSEASSIFPHYHVQAVGNYRDSPFVTGGIPPSGGTTGGLETEILDYATSTWVQGDDYPFSNNNQYVLNTIFVWLKILSWIGAKDQSDIYNSWMQPCKIDSENWTFFRFHFQRVSFRLLIVELATILDKTQVWPRKSILYVQIYLTWIA